MKTHSYLMLVMTFLSSMAYAGPVTHSCKVKPMYGYRTDGTAGRLVQLTLKGKELKGDVLVNIESKYGHEKYKYQIDAADSAVIEVLLPSSLPTDKSSDVRFRLKCGKYKSDQILKVSPMRHWTVYLFNHSHVDIGYTNTQKNVETLHKNNVLEGIKLGRATANHVEGARYVWNPEVTWPVERLWNTMPEKRDEIIQAIKDKVLCLDASYLNLNTSICLDEELFHVFNFSRKMQHMTGQPADVFQQFDIPGITWGLIPVMAQQGIKYIISWPNTDRAGNAHLDMDGKPFWWIGPDGKSKVLFLQPGIYANSGSMKKGEKTGRPWFGQRNPDNVPLVIKTGEANVDFTQKLTELEKQNYPYDFTVLSWTLWDNCPLDADIPYAVQEWNKKYAFPKIQISGGHDIMAMIEKKYGDSLPSVKGDYTEYWTDGLGTAAALTAINRNNKERVSQAETVWTMLAKGKAAPREEFNDAWKYILLGSEHTWCFENPSEPYFQDAIWKVKQSYFHEAEDRSINALDRALDPATDKSDGAFSPKGGPAKGGVAVFNTHSWNHGGVVRLNKAESQLGDKVIDQNGKEVPSQRLSTGELIFLAQEVPALGSSHYRVVEGVSAAKGYCAIHGTVLENDLLKVEINKDNGNIVSLTKKGSDYNYIDPRVDGGANSFSWLPANIDNPHADTVKAITVVENGPLLVELRIDSKAKGCRSVSRSVRLTSGQPWVEISNVVDKLPLKEKDGIHFGFGFNVPDSRTRVDIPWGVMEIDKDQLKQGNRNWIAVQRWLDVSNDTHGVTWSSLDTPLFEYGERTANIALGWGGKGSWRKKLKKSSTIYSWVMNNHWHTNYPTTQEGPVTFRYRIYPHEVFNITEANRFGLQQAQPLIHVAADKNPDLKPLLKVDNEKVYVTILKSTDKDQEMIVRLRSMSDKPEKVNLTYPQKQPSKVNICKLEEIPGEAIHGTIDMLPYGQLTLLVRYN